MREPCPLCGIGVLSLCPPRRGIINLDKPKGLTSHDVVERIRRVSGLRRVGHAGTLDPMATGVLLVLLGQGTRVAEYLMNTSKVYQAGIHLGVATDTGDLEGKVTSRGDSSGVSLADIEETLDAFRGEFKQEAPAYSALKHKGQPLYRLARRGVEVRKPTRKVRLHHLEILDWNSPLLEMKVECSPGTYMRALARDLGERLGCGAHLASLVRLASGRFTLEKAIGLEDMEGAFQRGDWGRFVHPIDEAFLDLEAMVLDGELEQTVYQGRAVPAEGLEGSLVRAYSPSCRFAALLASDGDLLRPLKVFHADN